MTYLSLQRQAPKLLAIKTMLTNLVKQNSINLQREFWVKDTENNSLMASVEHCDMMQSNIAERLDVLMPVRKCSFEKN